jgi:two-component system chemotaxis response regulator CheB
MSTPDLSIPRIRVLIVDDSALNRRSLGETLEACPDVTVVGKAADGEEALRLATTLKPDVITLDLEMPRMDGFTFLRILMSKQPTPVIVVSSYAQKENVFRALELGALDFVAKPDRVGEGDRSRLAAELISKVLLARTLRRGVFVARPPMESFSGIDGELRRSRDLQEPARVVAIASSTGGPTALLQVVSRFPAHYPHALLVTQHMPERFTRTFAERLDRRSELFIAEAADQDQLTAGMALVCPGGHSMEVEPGPLRVRVRPAQADDRYVPSGDRLLSSVARVFGARAVGVILTGMGDDGVEGARAIVAAGGTVIAESEATAVVYGMPAAAVRAGVVSQSLALPEIAEYLSALRVPTRA